MPTKENVINTNVLPHHYTDRTGVVRHFISGSKRLGNTNKPTCLTSASYSLPEIEILDLLVQHHSPDNLPQAAKSYFYRLPKQRSSELLQAHQEWAVSRLDRQQQLATGTLLYQASNQTRQETKPPTPIKNGLSINDLSLLIGTDKQTTTRLLEAAGWLELAGYGGTQQRRLLPDTVILKGYGANLTANKSGIPFPVFNPIHKEDIIWTLGWDKITEGVNAQPTKKAKAAWLLTHHSYLPDKIITSLSKAGLRTVKRYRQNGTCK